MKQCESPLDSRPRGNDVWLHRGRIAQEPTPGNGNSSTETKCCSLKPGLRPREPPGAVGIACLDSRVRGNDARGAANDGWPRRISTVGFLQRLTATVGSACRWTQDCSGPPKRKGDRAVHRVWSSLRSPFFSHAARLSSRAIFWSSSVRSPIQRISPVRRVKASTRLKIVNRPFCPASSSASFASRRGIPR